MKNVITFLSILFLFLPYVNGQIVDNETFAPLGATWQYRIVSPIQKKHFVVTYSHDSLMLNEHVMVMKTKIKNYFITDSLGTESLVSVVPSGDYYFLKKNDSVFYYNSNTNVFDLIYVFNLTTGGSYTLNPSGFFLCDSTVMQSNLFVVENMDQASYSGRQFNVNYFYEPPYFGMGYKVIKNIGSATHFLPQPSVANCPVIDGAIGSVDALDCYYDNIRGIINLSFPSNPCYENLFSNLSIEEGGETMSTTNINFVYPNPSQGLIYVNPSLLGFDNTIELIDMKGKTVYKEANTAGTVVLPENVSGIYIIRLTSSSKTFLQKLIINR